MRSPASGTGTLSHIRERRARRAGLGRVRADRRRDADILADRRPAARQSDALRAHLARGRAAGRAGQGHRCSRCGPDGRDHRPARFLLDLARGLRQPAGPAADLRPGLSHLLAQPRSPQKDDGAGFAGTAGRGRGGRAGRNGAALGRGVASEPSGALRRSGGARDRDRRGHDLFRPRAAAPDGFREDVARRAGARQGGDRPAAAAGPGCRRPAASRPTGVARGPICGRRCGRPCARAA